MTVESEASGTDTPTTSTLIETAEAVREADAAVEATTRSLAEAIEADGKRSGALDHLARATRGSPVQALLIAFLLGAFVGRRWV
jgi:hypothetical protein